ncbi:hypothetical protein ABPG75_008065 [Micractinium tetrahymenae]
MSATKTVTVPIAELNMNGWESKPGTATFVMRKGAYASGNTSLISEPGSMFDSISTDFYSQPGLVAPGEFVLVESKCGFSPALLERLGVARDTGRRASQGFHVNCPIMQVAF